MDNNNTQPMQKKLLEIISWFHDFCLNNNLRYYALGGTLLGAMRHEGFIPWDDDIDVGMPRKDYKKFSELMRNEYSKRYILETPDSEAVDYNYCFYKLYDTQTTLVENSKYKIRRGIYIDIFPLDGMGNSEKEAKKTFTMISLIFKLLLAHTTGIRKGRSYLKNFAVMFTQTLLNPFINDKQLNHKVNAIAAKKDFDDYEFVANPFGAYSYKEIVPKYIFGIPKMYKFEDIEIFGPEDGDAYLTHVYGDWRKLPPVEKRVSHHDFLELNLNKSYLED